MKEERKSNHGITFISKPTMMRQQGLQLDSSTSSMHPFDEDDSTTIPFADRLVDLQFRQTFPCMQALVAQPFVQVHILEPYGLRTENQEVEDDTKVKVDQDNDEEDIFAGLVATPVYSSCGLVGSPVCTAPFDSPVMCPARHHPWDVVSEVGSPFDVSTMPITPVVTPPSPPRPLRMPFLSSIEPVGPTSARVYKLTLPPHLVTLLDPLIAVAEAHATRMFSRVSVADIPGGVAYSRPVVDYLTRQIQILYQCRTVWLDQNQPIVYKFSATRAGREEEADDAAGMSADVTANLMMSRPTDHYGRRGEPWYEESSYNKGFRLQQGECLLHPGNWMDDAIDACSGTRYILVLQGSFETLSLR